MLIHQSPTHSFSSIMSFVIITAALEKIKIQSTKHKVTVNHHLMENQRTQLSINWDRVACGHDLGFCQGI
jgi:hypothetical protein